MATLTTPKYGFPYPDGAERVMDGDNAMGALALAVENLVFVERSLVPQFAQGSSALTLTQSDVLVPGCSITINPTAQLPVVMVTVFADFAVTTTGTGILTATLYLDGTARSGSAIYDAGAGTGRATVGLVYQIPAVPAGARTFEVRAKKANAGGVGVANALQTRMVLHQYPA